MSAKLCIGLQKKVGLPDYGSLGASCHVELDVEPTLFDDLQAFHHRARRAYAACQQAVQDQLASQRPALPTNAAASDGQAPSVPHRGMVVQRQDDGPSRFDLDSLDPGSQPHRRRPLSATVSQARAIRAIAKRQEIDLDRLLGQKYRVLRPEDLTIGDASALIDELKTPAER